MYLRNTGYEPSNVEFIGPLARNSVQTSGRLYGSNCLMYRSNDAGESYAWKVMMSLFSSTKLTSGKEVMVLPTQDHSGEVKGWEGFTSLAQRKVASSRGVESNTPLLWFSGSLYRHHISTLSSLE